MTTYTPSSPQYSPSSPTHNGEEITTLGYGSNLTDNNTIPNGTRRVSTRRKVRKRKRISEEDLNSKILKVRKIREGISNFDSFNESLTEIINSSYKMKKSGDLLGKNEMFKTFLKDGNVQCVSLDDFTTELNDQQKKFNTQYEKLNKVIENNLCIICHQYTTIDNAFPNACKCKIFVCMQCCMKWIKEKGYYSCPSCKKGFI